MSRCGPSIPSTTSRRTARKQTHVNGFAVCTSQSGNFLISFYQNVNPFGTKEISSHDISHVEEVVGTDITELVDGNLIAVLTPTTHLFLLYKEIIGGGG